MAEGHVGGEEIVVIGAGVVGLSAALRLQQDGCKVTIMARDFPAPFEIIDSQSQLNYTSPWAGAHNRWIPPTNSTETRDHELALITFEHMEQFESMGKSGEAGITFMKGIEYLEDPPQQYVDLTNDKAKALGMKEFRLLDKKTELPPGVEWGCEYRTWCVNPMMYCCFLLRQFVFLGGKTLKREVRDPSEIFAMDEFRSVKKVINCSGVGFGDEKVFPTRGLQGNSVSWRITATLPLRGRNKDGTWVVIIPRNYDGGTVIGGTRDVGDWNPHPHEQVRAQMLANVKATYPALLAEGEDFRVVRDVVGRRPTREGGARLEVEVLEDKRIIHAYGLGGRGYECSWGVAEKVCASCRSC